MGNVITDLASGAAGGILGGVGSLVKDIRNALGKVDPDKALELSGKLDELESAAMAAQTKIDEIEAGSPTLFVSGWRPFIGWTCGVAFAYNYLFSPLVQVALELGGSHIVMPVIDMATMMPVLIGMLGLGAYRTVEKIQGVARK